MPALTKIIPTLTPWAIHHIREEVETEVSFCEQTECFIKEHFALCKNEPINAEVKKISEALNSIIAIQQGRLFYTE